jgi:acetolactate decarboxylase
LLKKRPVTALLSIGFIFFYLTGCSGGAANEDVSAKRETLYQVSTLNALLLGYYDGIISVGDLLQEGDIGLGTFDALDGEMIVLDGTVYQAKADGTVSEQPEDRTVPFAAVTYFDPDLTVSNLSQIHDLETLKTTLDQKVLDATGNPNIFYVAKLTGDFNMIHVPDYVDGINLSGWHVHFLATDATKGGHLLDADLNSGECQADFTHEFKLFLPENTDFGALSLANDLQQDTQAVEGKQENSAG